MHAQRPPTLQHFALATTSYVTNRSPTKANPGYKTPYEMLYGVRPRTYHLRIWGCPAYVVVYDKANEGSRIRTAGIFVGYSEPGPGYFIFNPETARTITSWGGNTLFDEAFGCTAASLEDTTVDESFARAPQNLTHEQRKAYQDIFRYEPLTDSTGPTPAPTGTQLAPNSAPTETGLPAPAIGQRVRHAA
ncbi:MAG: hypothetical protein AAFY57_20470, partial [Cyanobacteria bacterium J06642_2]